MTSPITSRTDDPYRSMESSRNDDLTCHEGPLASQSSSSSQPPLCSAFETSTLSVSASDVGVSGPHAEAHADHGDLYAGAFALRGRDAASGVEVEVFSVSAHQGDREQAVQAGMARIGGSTDDRHFSARGEVFTAQAHASFDNSDGSTGFGASAGATVVGGEVTATWGPVSVTAGASIGATVGGSIGVRDSDGDGEAEYCARADFGVGTLGVCLEKVW